MAALLLCRLWLPAGVAGRARTHADQKVECNNQAPLVLTLCCVSPPAAEAAPRPRKRLRERRWDGHRPNSAQGRSPCRLVWALRRRAGSAGRGRSRGSGEPNGQPHRAAAGGGNPEDFEPEPGAVDAAPPVCSKTGPSEARGPCVGAARRGTALRSWRAHAAASGAAVAAPAAAVPAPRPPRAPLFGRAAGTAWSAAAAALAAAAAAPRLAR